MKKSISFGLTLLIIPFFLAQNILAAQKGIKVSSQSGEKFYMYKDYHALVVGVGDYDFWPDLQGAVNDAEELAEYLKLSGMNVSLVLNPNSRELKKTLNKLTYGIGREKDRAILLFYSGHGETETLTTDEKLGYIIPKDCPTISQDYMGFTEKAISMNQIETYALRIRSKHVLMVFDSCFSGSVFSSLKGVPTDISEKSNRPVRQFITAGNENEQVPDESVFKTCFIQGLDGEADYNKDGYVTGSELGMYLDTSVVNYSRGAQHPQYGKIRHPKLDKGDFIFVKSEPDELEFYKRKAEQLEQENETLRQQLESQAERKEPKIVKIPQAPEYFSPSSTSNRIDSAGTIFWSDYSRPLKLKSSWIRYSYPLKVRVNIPETFINKFEKIPLAISITTLTTMETGTGPYLILNNNGWFRYNLRGSRNDGKKVIEIPVNRLKAKENTLEFFVSSYYDRYELLELSFKLPKNNISSN